MAPRSPRSRSTPSPANTRLLRADLLHDVGRSLNPAIDRGQIEGGFIQGMGWLTMEEVVWDDQGRLLTHAPSTYKIPVASDCPAVFNVWLWEKGENVRDVAHRSKAVGEPPLMLALSVFQAHRRRGRRDLELARAGAARGPGDAREHPEGDP